jgi:hypothetical protein
MPITPYADPSPWDDDDNTLELDVVTAHLGAYAQNAAGEARTDGLAAASTVAGDLTTHAANVTDAQNLTTRLAAKSDTGHTHDDRYFTEAEVTALLAREQTAALALDMPSITANDTLQNITGLAVALGASATEMWQWAAWLLLSTTTNGSDIKLGMTVPSAATARWGSTAGSATVVGWSTLATTQIPTVLLTEAETLAAGGRSTGTVIGLALAGIVFGGGNAGNMQLQVAQNTNDAGVIQVLKGSNIQARRLAT